MKIGDGSITYSKYWSDGHFAVKVFNRYVALQGAIVAKYNLRSIIDVDTSSQYHFKFYALCNAYSGAYVEGQISVYGGVSAEILWSNNKITSVSVDNDTMELVINSNDNMYEGFLSIGSGDEWTETF